MIDKHVKKKESASLPKIIAKYGYNGNMYCVIQGGSTELGVVGFSPFKTTIGAAKIQYFIKNWRTPTGDIGKPLYIAMALTQYSAGVPYPILSKTVNNLS